MKSARIFILALLILPQTLRAAASGPRTVAVMYFRNNAMLNAETMAPLEKGLCDMLITELSKIEALKVVERAQLQALLKEMKLGQTGVIDESTAQQMGKLLGAETLLLGSFATDLSGKKMRIDARLVETETGVTLKAEEMTDKTQALFKMVNKLARKIAKRLDVKLSKADEKRLGERENESFEATLLYSRGIDYEDDGEYEKALEIYRQALKINPRFGKVRERVEALEKELE